MDLLVQLSDIKAKSMAYSHNNHKIQKIRSTKRRKEEILENVKHVKEQLQRWRAWTKNVLDVDDDIVKQRKAAK